MNPDKLREHLTTLDAALGQRAEMLWSLAAPIHARQSRPDSNENGVAHCQMVASNVWHLLHDSGTLDRFSATELFLLSCSACCHDFDKGLSSAIPVNMDHGEASGRFVIDHASPLALTYPESIAIDRIVSVHDKKGRDLAKGLCSLPPRFPLAGEVADLRKLAVVLKTADVLHTDNSRIADVAVDVNKLSGLEKKKHLARQCVTGWYLDGTRIIISAYPQSTEQMEAFRASANYMRRQEWPAVGRTLRGYYLPHKLRFEVDGRLLDKAALTATAEPLSTDVKTLRDVFQFYYDKVKPLYCAILSRNTMPSEALFEIVAAFDHVSRRSYYGEPEVVVAQKVYAHLCRACFDLFKLAVSEAMNKYTQLCEIDTIAIEDGDFDKRLCQLAASIRKNARVAHQLEGKPSASVEAFQAWSSVLGDCLTMEEKFFLHPDVRWSKKRRRWFRW